MGPGRDKNVGDKSKNFTGAIARILKELKPFRLLIAIALASAIIGTIISLAAPNFLSDLTDEISAGLLIGMDFGAINSLALILATLYLVGSALEFVEAWFMSTVSNNFARLLRRRISTKINRLPLKYFDKNQTGDTLSRVTNDVDTVAQSLNQSLSNTVASIVLLFGVIFMMFITNWQMALTAIIASLLGFVFMALILARSQKYFVTRQRELGKLNAHIEEIYSGLNIVKAYNGQRQATQKFNRYNRAVYDANRKSQFLSGLMPPMMHFIGNLGYVAVCIVGALLAMDGVITFGVIVAFIMYVRLFASPLSEIAQGMTSLQSTAAAAERVFEFLDESEMPEERLPRLSNVHIAANSERNAPTDSETTPRGDLPPFSLDQVHGDIEFRHVRFGYHPDQPIIKNFSAHARPGQKIAIVGPTGAGKTTMVNLLMKFYDFDSGDILIDGVSINKLGRDNVHELFTMVLQDTWVFQGTIRENIVYNNKVSPGRLREICDAVGLTHFINTLPDGLDTELSDNDSISAGQRQLITIARGMVEDSPFLILDEATSNVDTRTEELVQHAMDKLMEGRTSFIIAHRLSTIKNADLILVMNEGNIIEQGTHAELIQSRGFYAELYNSQFSLD